jgi:DTW domain-containing protein YfiP
MLLPEVCLCADIPPVGARTQFVILRHASERNRSTNSARWAALALGCEVLDYGAPGEAPPLDALAAPGTWVLFPSPAPAPAGLGPPQRVIVLDGSWSQARRMIQRVPALRDLPRLSIAEAPPLAGPRLRRPPLAEGMSTIEAMARALAALDEPGPAAALERVHALARERVWRLRGILG